MDGWLGALVSLSLVVAAAPTLAVVSPAEPVEDATASNEPDPRVNWGTSLLVEAVEPRLYFEASLEDGNSTATLELRMAETETEIEVTATPDEDEPLREPFNVEVESGETGNDPNPCVQIYLPQTPPIALNPNCLPEIDDTSRPVR